MAFVDGPAGSMKTYIAVYAGLELIRDETFTKLVYIRSIAESAEKSLGSLPGEIDDKFSPYAIPLDEKVSELTFATNELERAEKAGGGSMSPETAWRAGRALPRPPLP